MAGAGYGSSDGAMTEADPDDVGPDGTVRLRCYLPSADTVWFLAGCEGQAGCGHVAPNSIRAAIRFAGSAEATVGELERRLRCGQCGNRQVGIVLQPDTRPAAVRESVGPRPETRAGLPDKKSRKSFEGCRPCSVSERIALASTDHLLLIRNKASLVWGRQPCKLPLGGRCLARPTSRTIT